MSQHATSVALRRRGAILVAMVLTLLGALLPVGPAEAGGLPAVDSGPRPGPGGEAAVGAVSQATLEEALARPA